MRVDQRRRHHLWGTHRSLKVPNRQGVIEDVVLGFDCLAGYVQGKEYTGATVGRYANRIARGRFALDGFAHYLPINAPPNSMHGGVRGFDRRIWRAVIEEESLTLTYQSFSGEEGYPGFLETLVRYTLIKGQLVIDYTARSSAPTVLNLTNHSYFNLTGNPETTILEHEIALNADYYTPIDATMIPTGELRNVAGTAFDFREAAPIGARIGADSEQLQWAGGFDHNWVLHHTSQTLDLAATVYEPASGRVLEVWTTQPGLQFYTGNNLNGLERGRNGIAHGYRCALCLETQHFPDSPNHANFPSTELRAGDEFHSTTALRFGIF